MSDKQSRVEKIKNFIYPKNENDQIWEDLLPSYQKECVEDLLAIIDERSGAKQLAEALKKIAASEDCDCEPSDWRCSHKKIDVVKTATEALRKYEVGE